MFGDHAVIIAAIRRWVIVLAAALASATGASAGSLSVSPVSLEVAMPGKATTLTLRNSGASPMRAQVRVFAWRQENGRETLTPTREVVASPPEALLKPGADYTVRLVQAGDAPARAERSYRVIIDELPDARRARGAGVAMALRYSVPLFFSQPAARSADLNWRLVRMGGRPALLVENPGNRRVRLSAVSVEAGGRRLRFGEGLLGYVLAGSAMVFPAPRADFPRGAAQVRATTDFGPVHAPISR